MVRITDEGSHFEVPVEKVWKLLEAHGTEMTKIHPEAKNPKLEVQGENFAVVSWQMEQEGHNINVKVRTTRFPPLANVIEVLDGPMAGTKFVNYYTPKGNRTGVTVVGDFHSPVIPEAHLEKAAQEFLDNGFNEDTAYLKHHMK